MDENNNSTQVYLSNAAKKRLLKLAAKLTIPFIVLFLAFFIVYSVITSMVTIYTGVVTSEMYEAIDNGTVSELPADNQKFIAKTDKEWERIVTEGMDVDVNGEIYHVQILDYYGEFLEIDYAFPFLALERLKVINQLEDDELGNVQLEEWNDESQYVINESLPYLISDPIIVIKKIPVESSYIGTEEVFCDADGCYYEEVKIYFELDYDKFVKHIQEKYKTTDHARIELFNGAFDISNGDMIDCYEVSTEQYLSNPIMVSGQEVADLAASYDRRIKYCMIGGGYLPPLPAPEMSPSEIYNVGSGRAGCAQEKNTTDCSSFVQSIYNVYGISVPKPARNQATLGVCVKPGDIKPGDLIFYLNDLGRERGVTVASHVAMYIGDGKRVHASGRVKGVIIDDDLYGASFQFIKRMIP